MTELSRRELFRLGGWIALGTGITACLPSLENTPEAATAAVKPEFTADSIYIFNETRDYSCSFDPNGHLISVSNEYGIPLQNYNKLKVHFIQGSEFPVPDAQLAARIDEEGFGVIALNIGMMEEIIYAQTGHYPNSMVDDFAMSGMASHAFFNAYSHIAAIRGLITNQEADLLTQKHYNEVINGDNRLLVTVKIAAKPSEPVPTSAS